jgi:hypothetical protein
MGNGGWWEIEKCGAVIRWVDFDQRSGNSFEGE